MNGCYDYITISGNGSVKRTSSDNANPEFILSETLIRFSLVDYGQDVRHETLTVDGWVELKECSDE